MPLPRLWQQLDRWALENPDGPAVRDTDGTDATLTWGRWRAAAMRLAGAWRGQDWPAGRIMLALENRPAFHVAFVATLLADRDVLPVSPKASPAELKELIERGGVAVLVGEPAVLESLCDTPIARWPAPDLSAGPIQPVPRACAEPPPRTDNADESAKADELHKARDPLAHHTGNAALVLATSGTTGEAKLVRRPLPTLDAVARNCVETIGLSDTDRILMSVPVHHSYGLEHGLLAPLWAGAAVDLARRFDMHHLAGCFTQTPISVLPAVPFVFESLPDALAGVRVGTDPTALSLKRAYSAGGPLPSGVVERWDALGIRLGQVYGSTEVGSVTFNDPDLAPFDPASVGRPMRDVKIEILDPDAAGAPGIPGDADDNRSPQPLETEGEIAIRAPSMLAGYIHAPSPLTSDGLFRTGDLGRLSEDGQLTVTGRVKLLIDVGGLKVNPLEVENVLNRHPAVREAVVVAAPVTETISRLKAIVVPNDAQRIAGVELRRFVGQALSGHKVPRLIELRESLPRNAAGKVQRSALGEA